MFQESQASEALLSLLHGYRVLKQPTTYNPQQEFFVLSAVLDNYLAEFENYAQ